MDSHTRGPQAPALLEQTIGENLRSTATEHGDRTALVSRHQGIRQTYAQLDAQVDAIARSLLAMGVVKGDRVALWSPNRAEWTWLQYATARMGAILVNINPAYRTHELAYALDQSGAKALFSAQRFKTSDYVAMVQEVRPGCAQLEDVVFLDGHETWDAFTKLTTGDEALAAAEQQLDRNDPINIQYTSGTTGAPKGATLTHRNILNNGYLVGEACGFTAEDRVCIPVPFYHCFGMVMGNLGSTTHGATMVIPEAAFDPQATLQAVAEERCTALYGVPTMFIAELGLPGFADYDLTSLRTGIMAGSPCPVEVMKRVMSDMHMDEVTIAYGMTETSPVSTQTGADDTVEKRVGSVGRVHPHVEIKIVDPATGETAPRGTAGELCTRGYSVMRGYWEDPERTAEAIDADGFMHTGDLATMDDDGYVNIVGRSKDMVIRGGENVYPREVEEFLYAHPAVADVQVIGVPDPRFGEELLAAIILKPDASATDEEIKDFCRGRIAHYKVPRYVEFVAEFPMTVTGKIQKFKMREDAIERLGLTVEQTA